MSVATPSSAVPAPQSIQHPNWCWTLHFGKIGQPDKSSALASVSVLRAKCVYIVWGVETCPSTGQEHLQGYAQLTKKARLSELKKVIPTAHWEPAGGSDEENRNYCLKLKWKDDGSQDHWVPNEEWHEEGTRRTNNPGKRERDRWGEALLAAKEGRYDDVDPQIFLQHYSSVAAIARDYMSAPTSLDDVCGVWITGPTGAGKSHHARTLYPDHYAKMANKWFDGVRWDHVCKHKYMVLDDMDHNHVKLGHHLKIWADKYPFIAEIKGSSRYIRPEVVCVTSQYTIEEIWAAEPATVDALKRRFKVITLTVVDGIQHIRTANHAKAAAQKLSDKPPVVETIELDGDSDDEVQVVEALNLLPLRRSVAGQFNAPPTTPVVVDLSRECPGAPALKKIGTVVLDDVEDEVSDSES